MMPTEITFLVRLHSLSQALVSYFRSPVCSREIYMCVTQPAYERAEDIYDTFCQHNTSVYTYETKVKIL